MWKKSDIENKWPALRMVGPNVSRAQAMDFIWRTDFALQWPGSCCNDDSFCDELSDWLGFPHGVESIKERLATWDKMCRNRGQVFLHHLESNWVGTFSIYGPSGIVHPDGTVSLATNIGKWPTIEEIERDLEQLVSIAPWLSCVVGLWDMYTVIEDGEDCIHNGAQPDFCWVLENGSWERAPANRSVFGSIPIPATPCGSIISRIENTWSMVEIENQWRARLTPDNTVNN